MSSTKLLALSAAAAFAAGAAGTVTAAGAQTTTAPAADATTVTVTAAPALKAGDRSPFDVPGVRAIRRGKAIPSGYRLKGFALDVQGTGPSAGAFLRVTCPSGTTLRSFATQGGTGFRAEGPNYVGRRTAFISSGLRRGQTGTIYAICR